MRLIIQVLFWHSLERIFKTWIKQKLSALSIHRSFLKSLNLKSSSLLSTLLHLQDLHQPLPSERSFSNLSKISFFQSDTDTGRGTNNQRTCLQGWQCGSITSIFNFFPKFGSSREFPRLGDKPRFIRSDGIKIQSFNSLLASNRSLSPLRLRLGSIVKSLSNGSDRWIPILTMYFIDWGYSISINRAAGLRKPLVM